MVAHGTIDFLGAGDVYDLNYETFIPDQGSSVHSPCTKQAQNVSADAYSCTNSVENEDIDEYAQGLFQNLLPMKQQRPSQRDGDSTIHSPASDFRSRFRGPSLSDSLHPCTQLGMQLSPDNTTLGMKALEVDRGNDSVNASWGSSTSIGLTQPDTEVNSSSTEQKGVKFINSCTSPRSDSPIIQWIIARLEDWQQHLNRFPTACTAAQHLHNIATALSQLEQEVGLIRSNLLGRSAKSQETEMCTDKSNEPSGDDELRFEDSKVAARSLIVHVRSNTFVFSLDQLCHYMYELPAWTKASVLPHSIVFWHHSQDELGFFMEKPDACAALPDADLARLNCEDAHKFVNTVNKVEGRTIFRVQTALVREQVCSDESE
ncbi:hypothetical protein MPTK1_8g05260 [Marchantia polymorpha subsp. ruderalis]